MLLGGLRELEELNVAYDPHLTDGCLLEWGHLQKLRAVSLDSCSNVANRFAFLPFVNIRYIRHWKPRVHQPFVLLLLLSQRAAPPPPPPPTHP